MSEISYVVVCYNSVKHIEKCIDSIIKQTHTNSEIIIIDNHSSDNTVVIAKELASRNKNINLILNSENLGYGEAINETISICKGQFIAILNADTLLDSHWADRLLNVLKSNEKIMSVSGIVLFPNGEIQSNGGMMDKYGAVVQKNSKIFYSSMVKDESIFYNDGSAFMIRKICFQELQFDPKLFLYYEDVDLSWKIRMMGYEIGHDPNAISYHDVGHSHAEMTLSKFYYISRNRIYMCQKNYSIPKIIRRVPLILLLVFVNAIVYDLYKPQKGYLFKFLKTIIWNVGNFRSTIKEQRKLRSISKISDNELDKFLINYSIEMTFRKYHD